MTDSTETFVLLIEDNPGDAFIIERGLRKMERTQLVHFERAEEALSWLQERDPALVIMDWHMPGLDGRALLDRVRAETAAPVVVMSGQETLDETEEGLDAVEFIPKPSTLDELRRVLAGLGERFGLG